MSQAAFVGQTVSSSTSTPITFSTFLVTSLPSNVVYVDCASVGTGRQITSISGLSGTWSLVGSRVSSGTTTQELWIGYNFPAAGGTGNISIVIAGTGNTAVIITTFQFPGPVTSAPSTTQASSTGTASVTVNPGGITPSVDQLVVYGAAWAHATQASATTDTPGGAEQFATFGSGQVSGVLARVEGAWHSATTVTTLNRTQTITAANWAASLYKITPAVTTSASLVPANADVSIAALSTLTGFVYKGHNTATLDDGSVP